MIEEGLCSRTLCSGRIDIEEEREINGFLTLKSCMDAHDEFDVFILMLGVNDFKRCYNNTVEDICGFYERYIEVLKNYRSKVSGEPIKFFILSGTRPLFDSDDKVFDTETRWLQVDDYMMSKHSDIYVSIPPKFDVIGDRLHFTKQDNRIAAEVCYAKIQLLNY